MLMTATHLKYFNYLCVASILIYPLCDYNGQPTLRIPKKMKTMCLAWKLAHITIN